MHTLHYFAVEAEDSQEAFDTVQSRLLDEGEGKFVEWSDWHVVGGGRWSKSQYEDTSDTVISYATDPKGFMEAIEGAKQGRINEMNRYLEQMDYDKLQSDIVDYISNNCLLPNQQRFDLNAYYFKKAGDMLMDYYTPDSYYYDLVEYTAHIGYLQERLDNPEVSMKQFLVPVDFHF